MINTKALREKILDLAMRGKLVPQDPTNEPASELLKRIKEEKEQLIKEKKIRRDKNETEIFQGDDGLHYEKFQDGTVKEIEVPYELPEGWAWSRLSCVLFNRDSERKPVSITERKKRAKIYDYYGASGIIDKIDSFLFDKTLLLIGEDGANLISRTTPIAFLAKGKYWVNNHAHVLDAIDTNILKFTKYYINSISLLPYITGTAQPKLNQTNMNKILIPVPPISEQILIIRSISNYLSLVSKIETEQKSLNQLSDQLKKKVLETAMQGKLVPQDPSDEPASVLLKKIRAEKQRLYEEGKLKKKDLQESIIYKGDDNSYYQMKGNNKVKINIPYEIPVSWQWCYLADVIQLTSGRDLKKSQYNNEAKGIPYITGASNFQNGTIHTDRYTVEPQSLSNKTDLLISVKGTIGQMAFNPFFQSHIARQVMALQYLGLDLTYVRYYLESTLELLQNQAQSMIPGISRDVLLRSLIPIPPESEIERIIKRISLIRSTSL